MMPDTPDALRFTLQPDGEVAVKVGDRGLARTFDELLALAPEADAGTLADTINRLLTDGDYDLISDPDRYEQEYRARLAAESPTEPWRPGVVRLRDFGIPDFREISPPEHSGDRLVFFAADAETFLPYRVEAMLVAAASAPVYTPLGLTPPPEPPPDVARVDTEPDPEPDQQPQPGSAD